MFLKMNMGLVLITFARAACCAGAPARPSGLTAPGCRARTHGLSCCDSATRCRARHPGHRLCLASWSVSLAAVLLELVAFRFQGAANLAVDVGLPQRNAGFGRHLRDDRHV